jgi:phospholipase/carboxylesterase
MAELQAVRWGPASGAVARQLVVICHGVGANGQDLIDLAPHWGQALPDAVFAAPDAPEPYDGAPFGRQWWAIGDRDPARMAAGAEAARPLLDAFIEAELARLGLPADAYALMGFSQGAMMVLYAGLRRATAPKAILAYSGALIAPDKLAARANSAPVLLVHGVADDVVPAFRSRDGEAALRAAGVPVQSVFTPGLGHAIDAAGLKTGAEALRAAFAV